MALYYTLKWELHHLAPKAITNNFDECIDKQLIFHHGTILLQCALVIHMKTSACNNNDDVDVDVDVVATSQQNACSASQHIRTHTHIAVYTVTADDTTLSLLTIK